MGDGLNAYFPYMVRYHVTIGSLSMYICINEICFRVLIANDPCKSQGPILQPSLFHVDLCEPSVGSLELPQHMLWLRNKKTGLFVFLR